MGESGVPANAEVTGPVRIVRIADMGVLAGEGVLMAIGLGSCVGVALYDPQARVAGLAHVFLPAPQDGHLPAGAGPAKYADAAVPALIEAMVRQGARRGRLAARMAGGAQVFLSGARPGLDVGRRNVQAVQEALKREGVALIAQDTGGHRGRTMKVLVATGKVLVSALGQPPREL